MSGDIEDFLKRAAQRRQERQANQPPVPPKTSQPPPRPEYTDARRERSVSPIDDDDEIVIAQVVQAPVAERIAELKRRQAEAQSGGLDRRPVQSAGREPATRPVAPLPPTARQVPTSGRGAVSDRATVPGRGAATASVSATSGPGGAAQSGFMASGAQLSAGADDALIEQLLSSLRNPQGLKQAVLLHEILDRPVHRW